MAGNRLGRYEIIRTLAKGALTDLLLGRASGMEGFQRYVAIKLLRAEFARDPAVLESFVNEARLAAVLHHHNIVQVHDIGEEGGTPYFAMEYVHGIDLRTLLGKLARRNEQLPLQHVVSIVASAAAALHHAHEQRGPDGTSLKLVHRDVTPANILVGYDGNVKVVDFGIAKAAIKRISTDAGVLKGQAPYMSPEQCAGKAIDRRSDVFALGSVLYELATVRRLFKGATEFLTMSAVVNAEVPKPSQYRRDIPAQLEAIMLRALSRDPADRFQSAGEMSLALDQVASSVGVGASTTALANYMRLQFGDQKEPWLLPTSDFDEDSEPTAVDFDGAASGLAPPPTESVQKHAIPRMIGASKSSPIAAARTHAITPGPTENPRTKSPTLPEPRTKSPTRPPERTKTPTQPPGHAPRAASEVPTPDVRRMPFNRSRLAPIPGGSQEDVLENATTAEASRFDVATATEVDAHAPEELVEAEPLAPVPRAPTKPPDATAIVEPLRIPTAQPQRRSRRPLWVALGSFVVSGGVIAAIVMWPGAEVAPSAESEPVAVVEEPPSAPSPEAEPSAPSPEAAPSAEAPKSALEMTQADYERARMAAADAGVQVAEAVDDQAADPAAPIAKQPEEPAATKTTRPEEPIAKKPAAKPESEPPVAKKLTAPPKRTTAKAPPKRTVAKAPAKKKPAAKKAPKKPKWNPDDLFLDEK